MARVSEHPVFKARERGRKWKTHRSHSEKKDWPDFGGGIRGKKTDRGRKFLRTICKKSTEKTSKTGERRGRPKKSGGKRWPDAISIQTKKWGDEQIIFTVYVKGKRNSTPIKGGRGLLV